MKLLHTMIRVNNLDQTIDYYKNVLGMSLLRMTDRPEQKYTLAFMGYEDSQTEIELTYNYGKDSYEHGDAFGHLAIGTNNLDEICSKAEDHGGKIIRKPGPVIGGKTIIAFIEDPNGYKIELIQIASPSHD